MYSIDTPAKLDSFLNEIGLGVKVVKAQVNLSRIAFSSQQDYLTYTQCWEGRPSQL